MTYRARSLTEHCVELTPPWSLCHPWELGIIPILQMGGVGLRERRCERDPMMPQYWSQYSDLGLDISKAHVSFPTTHSPSSLSLVTILGGNVKYDS